MFISLLKSVQFLHSRKDGGCDTKIALPLFENQSIVEQPLDLWDLTEKYAKAVATQILTARYVTYESIHQCSSTQPIADTDIG